MKRSLLATCVGLSLFFGCKSALPATNPTQESTPSDPVAATQASTPGSPAPAQATNYSAERYRVVDQPDEIVSILDNGATVIAKHIDSPVVAMRAYTYTGGSFEGKWLGGGLSHLLEHLVAGGSNGRRTEEQNRDLLQRIGNNSNAYTSDDHTAFFVNTTKPHMEEAVDLVTGWVLTADIKPAEYRREYQVVQRELEMGKGDPDRQFEMLTQMNRYRVSPLRVPVIGYQAVIQGLSRDDVYTYYKLAYQPNNLVFSVSGDFPPEEMLKAVRKHVGDVPPGREFSRDVPAEPPVLSPRTVTATFPRLGQAKLELAFPSVRLTSQDLYALDLLSAILGQGESSTLVEEIRDNQQLVSGISVGDNTPSYVEGTFAIDMQLDAEKIPTATKAVLDQLEKLKTQPIDPERIKAAQTQIRTTHIKSMQTAEEVASDLATSYMFTGDIHFNDRYVEKISQVTGEQLMAIANKYLDRRKLITSSLLPAEYVGAAGLPKAEDLLRAAAPTTKSATTAPSEQITRVELENGTVLIHKQIATTPLVTISLYSLGGLTAEDAKTNGLGNLTMQMLPRGTTKRSAQQIAEFFDSIGGELNTGCGNNSWFWQANCLKEDFPKAMEAYADVINNPTFPDAELKPMKDRIAAEIDSEDADWEQQALRFFKQKYYGPTNSPYQFLPMGTKENVAKFTADDAKHWYNDKVLGNRRVLAIFGDVDLNQAQTLAATYFGGGPKAPPLASTPPQDAVPTSDQSTPFINVQRVDVNPTEQKLAGIFIGFNAHPVIGNPINFPITVADTMCSGYGYPTGYLFDTLRGRGLVYVVDAQNIPGQSQKTPGTFLVMAGCEPSKVNEVIDLILENIARLQGSEHDMRLDWFDRSKQLITTFDAMDNETPAAQATQAALDELYGLGYDYHQHFAERINAVKFPEVPAVARGLLRDCVITISTPQPEIVNKATGKREYRSFPPVDLTPRGVQHDTRGQ
ncbi:MAG TPA: pitrilysin family protein [Tepidisphaeraceae bacterium]|jgi:zinc protease|nr:pitrilysin family protein [Tepidisphaeraceae bacterium]